MSNEAKVIRGQLRQIAKELLPEALAHDIHEAHYKQLQSEIQGKLSTIEARVKEALVKIDERSKEMQAFVMRQMLTASSSPVPIETVQPVEDKSTVIS